MSLALPPLTLVVGAANSGKSAYAERLAEATGHPMTYIATAQAFDDEMRAKIAAHRARRGDGWTTVEAPLNLASALDDAQSDHVVLVDCMTLWLSNHLLSETAIEAEQARVLDSLASCAAPVVVVSNEVGAGVVPENALARRFRAAQGGLNQAVAARADLVVTVIAGLPLALKGALPQGIA